MTTPINKNYHVPILGFLQGVGDGQMYSAIPRFVSLEVLDLLADKQKLSARQMANERWGMTDNQKLSTRTRS